jgi:hypothetical protein
LNRIESIRTTETCFTLGCCSLYSFLNPSLHKTKQTKSIRTNSQRTRKTPKPHESSTDMKTKNALGGLLGLLGSFSALAFLTESLQQNQKRIPIKTQTKSNRDHKREWSNGTGRSESYLESTPEDLDLAFIPKPSNTDSTENETISNNARKTTNRRFATRCSRFLTHGTLGTDRIATRGLGV